jgi:glycosyltransferase involved in cell wall biosynthesis
MKVRFTGHLADITEALAASDLFAFPSRSEGFGLALAEGLVAGLPCVATPTGVAPELIQPGTNGFLVDRNDHSSLTKVLLMLTKNSNLRKRLTEGAKITPLGFPTPEEHGQRLFNLYESLLRKHTKN